MTCPKLPNRTRGSCSCHSRASWHWCAARAGFVFRLLCTSCAGPRLRLQGFVQKQHTFGQAKFSLTNWCLSPALGMCRCEKLPVQGLKLTASAPTKAEQAVKVMEFCHKSVCAFACVLRMFFLHATRPHCSMKHCCST